MTTNTCKKCRSKLSAEKAAYVFPQTGGLCWKCYDAIKDAAHFGNLTTAQKKTIKARQLAIENISQAEINLHCQFAGLPKIGKRK